MQLISHVLALNASIKVANQADRARMDLESVVFVSQKKS